MFAMEMNIISLSFVLWDLCDCEMGGEGMWGFLRM